MKKSWRAGLLILSERVTSKIVEGKINERLFILVILQTVFEKTNC
jgi:hypothetical protein